MGNSKTTTNAVVIAFFAMLGEVQPGDLDFFADAQAENSLDDVSDDRGADDRQHIGNVHVWRGCGARKRLRRHNDGQFESNTTWHPLDGVAD